MKAVEAYHEGRLEELLGRMDAAALVSTLESLLTEEEKEKFIGLNAQKLYGFNKIPILPYIKNMSE